MITPETRHIYQASFAIPNASKSIQEYLQQKSIHVNSNAPRILLVTGGCGFIGSTFINHWLETYPEDRIINIDRLDAVSNTKNIQNYTSANYSLIVADIKNKDIVLHLMKQYNITHIFHFASKDQNNLSFSLNKNVYFIFSSSSS
jgi:dTDP-D-glucose 4,6-dehydratase